jgi:ribonuclease HII
MTNKPATWTYDCQRIGGADWLIGVDEAGRGAWAGPVVAGAVAINCQLFKRVTSAAGLGLMQVAHSSDDSKQLTANQREAVFQELKAMCDKPAIRVATGWATVAEIEQLNILGATAAAMERAVTSLLATGLPMPVDCRADLLFAPAGPHSQLLVDGLPMKRLPYHHQALVGGDRLSLAIGLASIVAKVTRDQAMVALHAVDPRYGFARHKGYGTAAHAAAIKQHGPGAEHRLLFLRKLEKTPLKA